MYEATGRVLSRDQREFAQQYPQPGWVEHDPDDIWQSQLSAARRALEAAGAHARDVAALGITNQRETTIVWERATGRPIQRAIVWQDRRTAPACEELARRGASERVRELTGLVIDPYFSATKIAWLLDNVDGARERAQRGELLFGTVDTWLVWNLTGGKRHVTDVTNASRTLLFDIRTLAWSDELCEMFRVPPAILPAVLPCTADFGTTDAAIFGAPVAIAGIAGDQQAALIGQGATQPGAAKNTYGTGAFALFNTGQHVVRSEHGMITTVAYARKPGHAVYALEGSVFIAGAAMQWLRDGLGIIQTAPQAGKLAQSVVDSGGVIFVPAFTGLGAPNWDPHARGTLLGLTRGTTRAHIARAALEAMAYQSADVLDAMKSDAQITLAELRVDGGASASDLAMQFQADLLGVPVVRPADIETTARGAACLAGMQHGIVEASVRFAAPVERRFEPRIDARAREALLDRWHRAVNAVRAFPAGS